MPVVLTAVTLLMAILYFQQVKTAFVKEGVLWLAISVVIDLIMFSRGPMAMPLVDYVKDIELTYLIIPAITIGSGYLLQRAC